MKYKILGCIFLTLLCVSANAQTGANVSRTSVPEVLAVSMEANEEAMLNQFFEDANIPAEIRGTLLEAVHGDPQAQKLFDEYAGSGDLLSVKYVAFPYGSSSYVYDESECFYNIGTLYYDGKDYINFKQDKTKALGWFKFSAEKGSLTGALQAGDMLRAGDGISADYKAAFALYKAAAAIETDSAVSERLGDCYAYGIGVEADPQKAKEYYLDSAMDGNAYSLYRLSGMTDATESDLTALYKAASAGNYSGGYWAMVYGGLSGYSADAAKLDLIKKLSATRDSAVDPAAAGFKKASQSNEYFPENFVDAMLNTAYSYSYHAFAEQYGLRPNRTYEDGLKIKFSPMGDDEIFGSGTAERYLEYESSEFYEYDFDGDGISEIGIPEHSSAGGAFMLDGFGIYKKNVDGLYESFSYGPYCTLRDSMRLVQYNGKIYFILNPFDDTDASPHDIRAYAIDKNGEGHYMTLTCGDYSLRRVITNKKEGYAAGLDGLLAEIELQTQNAVDAVKQGGIYSPQEEKTFTYENAKDLWADLLSISHSSALPNDVFFAADVDNDGEPNAVHKGRLITQTKYYDDYNWFNIYADAGYFEKDGAALQNPAFYDDYYGLHSGGNIYEKLPAYDNVVQFWTREYNGKTYCIAIKKIKTVYTQQVFIVQNGTASIVSEILYLDEPKSAVISFEDR